MNRHDLLQYENVVDIANEFSETMHDYLYVYDIPSDRYTISESALERFNLPSSSFTDVIETHKQFVHPADLDMLIDDLDKMCKGLKESHNLQYRWLSPEGTPIWINCKGKLLRDKNGNPLLMIGCINELGRENLADNLTGLLSLTAFKKTVKTLDEELETAYVVEICIDKLDKLRVKFGEEYANSLQQTLCNIISNSLHEDQTAYHSPSGNVIILDLSGSHATDIARSYKNIRSQIDEKISSEQYDNLYTISAGALKLNQCSSSNVVNDIIKFLDFSIQEAAKRGSNQIYFFDHDDYAAYQKSNSILNEMRDSISNDFDGFDVHFQPIVNRFDENLHAAEALLRFKMKSGESISPVTFIPLLESSGLIIPVGKWILKNSLIFCREVRRIQPDFMISVNLSYIQLLKSPMYTEIVDALTEVDLPPSALIVELTESGHLENTTAVRSVWKKLKDYGVTIAIDDFGTGYSNLITIGNLKPNIVKIDRTFAMKALQFDYEFELLVHIIQMVHSLDLKLVIEGIETANELDRIQSLMPDYIQGYYYSKPCNREDFLKYMESLEEIQI